MRGKCHSAANKNAELENLGQGGGRQGKEVGLGGGGEFVHRAGGKIK